MPAERNKRKTETVMIKILVVDDRADVRRGLRMALALDPELMIVGEADDGMKAVGLTQALDPDVVLMDVELPGMDGISATRELRTVAPRSRVVILTLHDDAAMRTEAEAAGAAAFVGKCETTSALPTAIRLAACSGQQQAWNST